MNSLKGKEVLVTGATGFIGSRLAERLSLQEEAEVTGTGRKPERITDLRTYNVEPVSLDIRDTEKLERAIEGKEIIFHTAAVMDTDPDTARSVNIEATEALVQLAGKAGVRRIVHISTVGAYDMVDKTEVDESTPLALNHPATYHRTKAIGEKRAFEIAGKKGVEMTVVRPSMVYGPGHGIWTVGMFENVREGKPVFLGDGSTYFNPVYIDDVVDALVLCAKSPQAPGEGFNLSSEVTTWRDFMDYYGKLCGKEPRGIPLFLARLIVMANKIPGVNTPIDQGFIEMANSRKYFSIDKAEKLLGWSPQVNLEEGMAQSAQWLKEEGFLASTP